mmetsp:Transcript_80670/g.168213  ORF Transcript_80670/g.168213 Transcript_80670/m.168213 type:complete len:215 (-) Transcript_80670:492-1136(-)
MSDQPSLPLAIGGAARRMLDDPAPGEIDPGFIRIFLPWDSMLEVLLKHSLHRHDVACAKIDTLEAGFSLLPILWPIGPQIESAPLPKGQRDNPNVSEVPLKETLVVGVPTDSHAAVLVEIHVARVRPVLLVRQATKRHHMSKEIQHPLWVCLRIDFDGAVAVGASTSLLHHPSCLARNGAVLAHWLSPIRPFANVGLPFLQLLSGEGVLQVPSE